MSRPVYITASGIFLPNQPISNADIETYLGVIGNKPSRIKEKILKQNRIHTRYYALDTQQRTTHRTAEMAAAAIHQSLQRSAVTLSKIDFLAAATTQPDIPLPGFASMVHGELRNPPCEIASLHGVCTSGMMAIKAAYQAVLTGEKQYAIACASELPSRLLKSTHFAAQQSVQAGEKLPFDTEFLRWMLSDGAGALVLQSEPAIHGFSLEIQWIKITSYADRYPVCMYVGGRRNAAGELEKTWLEYKNLAEAFYDGAMNLQQDIRLLEEILTVGVESFLNLVQTGAVNPAAVQHVVCHYSSHIFLEKMTPLLAEAGVLIPAERWFTALYDTGNTGSAAIYISLDALWRSGRLRAGDTILCMVPESGRFTVAYMLLKVLENKSTIQISPPSPTIDLQTPTILEISENSKNILLQQQLVRELTQVWLDFEVRLNRIPLIEKLQRGQFTCADYQALLLNLRQQVMEGARWIARAASSLTVDYFPLRAVFIQHAVEEQRDFQMLEQNYVAVGGDLATIQQAEKNIGSEALSAWMFHQASRENPLDLLGAMFIIEGLGTRLARRWGEQIRQQLDLKTEQVSFLLYHGTHDVHHFAKLQQVLSSDILTPTLLQRIVKTAKVTARLYCLQLEEVK